MSANTLINPTGWGPNSILTYSHLTELAGQAAKSVNRLNTDSGYRVLPVIYSGSDKPFSGMCFNTTSENLYHFSLHGMPDGHDLMNVRVKLLPPSRQVMPQHLPSITVYKVNPSTGAQSSIGSYTYTDSELSHYSAQVISLTASINSGAGETIDTTAYWYLLAITSEWGTPSESGTKLCSIEADMDISTAYGQTDFTFWRFPA